MVKQEIDEASESAESEGHEQPRRTSIDKLHTELKNKASDDSNFIQAKMREIERMQQAIAV